MSGQVHQELQSYYRKLGIHEDTLINRLKQRNIRIQLCLNSVDLSRFSDQSDDAPDDVARIRQILENLPVTGAPGARA